MGVWQLHKQYMQVLILGLIGGHIWLSRCYLPFLSALADLASSWAGVGADLKVPSLDLKKQVMLITNISFLSREELLHLLPTFLGF